ncbi:MAG: divergent polysaccharide deacetylase family protein [Pseudomonadota bacterium]
MSRGLFAGLFWGGLVSVGGAVGLSLVAPVTPPQTGVETAGVQPETSGAPQPDPSSELAATELSKAVPPEPDAAPAETALSTATTQIATGAPAQPVQPNLVSEPSDPIPEATVAETADELVPANGTPTGEDIDSLAAAAPESAPALSAALAPVAPVAVTPRPTSRPVAVPDTANASPEVERSSGEEPDVAAVEDRLDTPDASPAPIQPVVVETASPSVEPSTVLAPAPLADDGAPVVAETLPPPPANTAPETQDITIAAGAETGVQQQRRAISFKLPVIENPVSDDPVEEDTQVVATAGVAASATPASTGVRATTFSGQGTQSRLPTLGGSTLASNPVEAPAQSGAALSQHASNFDSGGKPILSVILIDDGSGDDIRSKLADLDLPVTIAIDPARQDAKEVAETYRQSGFEVVALLNDLPAQAQPSDIAVALSGYFDVLDEAVAVMNAPGTRSQSNRALMGSVIGVLKGSGHGLITYSGGLNSAQQSARREGVPQTAVFRVLDAEQEPVAKIKRYLERAAFNANRDGSVVVLGHARSDTLSALLEWRLERKSAALALGPVSSVMQTR